MSDIPSELFQKILCRAPTKPLLRFRSVCKSWRRMIDGLDFIKSHIAHQPYSTSLGNLLIRTSYGGRLFSLPLDSLNFAHATQTINATPIKNLIRRGVPRILNLPIASCNGLILISHYDVNKIWVVWNPLTQEFYELPEYENDYNLRLKGCGIGYDIVNDDFKVVRIDEMYHNRKVLYKTSVYSLKHDSCRWIKDCPSEIRSIPNINQGVYLNGSLYWLSCDFIIVLDLSTENYRQLALPSVCSERVGDSDIYLEVLGGCLVLCCDYWVERLDGWMMNDDGGNISWTKLFSIAEMKIIGAYGRVRPITFSKSNRHVLFEHEKDFFWFDIDNNCAKKIRISGLEFDGCFSCQIWPGSLFRLENYVGADEVMSARTLTGVKRKRSPIKKLKLDVTIREPWDRRSYSNYSSDEDLSHSSDEGDY